MRQNPEIIHYDLNTYAIRYLRNDYTYLMWVQDICSRGLKDTHKVNRPVVEFSSRAEAYYEMDYVLGNLKNKCYEIEGW